MKVGLVHGVFDLLHAGHLNYLKQARRLCTTLVVSVIADKYSHKRPIYPEEERLALVRAIRYVDLAVLCNAEGPEDLLKMFHPDIYIRNDEYYAQDKPEYNLVRKLGIETGFTTTIPPHTSEIILTIRARP